MQEPTFDISDDTA